MRRLFVLFMVAVLAFQQTGSVSAQFVPNAGGGGASLTGTNDWTGTNQFTSTVKVYQTSTHSGTHWLSFANDGTTNTITSGGDLMTLSGASGNGAVSIPAVGGVTLSALNNGIFVVNSGSGSPFPRIQLTNTPKALTESAATAFVQIGVPAGSHTGVEIDYTIVADDGTDFQSRAGTIVVAAVNKASSETCTVSTVTTATEVVAVSAGTLTNTFTCDGSGVADGINILANAVSSLTQTTLAINYQVRKNGGLGAITAQ